MLGKSVKKGHVREPWIQLKTLSYPIRSFQQVKHDFVAFVRMFLIFMIVGGVTIQAVIYPHWPLSIELMKRIITRPIYGMFLTQVQDLDGTFVLCSWLFVRLFCVTWLGITFVDDIYTFWLLVCDKKIQKANSPKNKCNCFDNSFDNSEIV